jgi:hypothetical protein
VLVLLLLFALLATSAWRADRARGVEVAPGGSLPACSGIDVDEARLSCLEDAIATALRSARPLGDVLEDVNRQARRDEVFSRRCHMVMHEHGRRHDGEVAPGTITHDGKDCAAGFLHGWMMANLGLVDRPTVDAWCGAARTTLEHADCEHGMGHVVVRHLDGDLRAALEHCRTLGDADFLRNCASGAFMENRFGGQARDGAAPTDHWRDGDPWLPCRVATPGDLLDVCAAWAVRDVEASARLAWCDGVATRERLDAEPCRVAAGGIAPIDQAAQAACGESEQCWFGRGFAWAIIGWDHEGVEEAARSCLAGAGAQRDACARGVGFRRAASIADDVAPAASVACDHLFTGSARAACHAGAAERAEPIAYA